MCCSTLTRKHCTPGSTLMIKSLLASARWRHRHVDVFQFALDWLRPAADLVVDTVTVDALAASRQIRSAVDARL